MLRDTKQTEDNVEGESLESLKHIETSGGDSLKAVSLDF